VDKVIVDTNVFAAIFGGDAALKVAVDLYDKAINTIIYLELIQGSKSKAEVQHVEKYLQYFALLHCDVQESHRAIDLVRTYSGSHGLLLADAMIAASCLEKDYALLTFNVRDFHFISGLRLLKP
jgi:tRNA(fMet)-specific endonuclease VapC